MVKSQYGTPLQEKWSHHFPVMAAMYQVSLILPTAIRLRRRGPGLIRLIDLRTEKIRHVLAGHSKNVPSIVYSNDGGTLVSGGKDGTIRFWEVATGNLLDTITGPEDINCILLTPDQKTVLAGYAFEGTRSWDIKTKKVTKSFSDNSSGSCALSSNGKIAVFGSTFIMNGHFDLPIINLESDKPLKSLKTATDYMSQLAIYQMAQKL